MMDANAPLHAASAGTIRPHIAWLTIITGTLRVVDAAVVAVGSATAYWATQNQTALPSVYVFLIGCSMLLSVIMFHSSSAYMPSLIDNFWQSATRGVSVWLSSCLLLIAGAFFFNPDSEISRAWAFTAVSLVASGIVAVRAVVAFTMTEARKRGKLTTKVAIIGADDAGLGLHQQLAKHPDMIDLIGVYDDRMTRMQEKATPLGITIRGRVDDLLADARRGRMDSVIINLPWTSERRLRDLIEILRTLRVEVQLCPEGLGFVVRNFPLFRHSVATRLANIPLFTVVKRPLDGWGWLIKRIEDLVLVLLAAPIVLPVCALIAIAVKLDSPGKVLFRQDRSGFSGQTFRVYKFRTMHSKDGKERGDVTATARNDSRITRVGAWLRRTSLDELPQLLNVLKGEMSIIGPRPHAVSHDREFASVIRQYYARHRVLPGLTGWAQVNGFRGSIDDPEMIRKRVDHDLYYIENWSVGFDLKILLLTPFALIHRNAY